VNEWIELWRYAKADRARMTRLAVITLVFLVTVGGIITVAIWTVIR